MRLTDEQFSMILSAHEDGMLHYRGIYDWYYKCPFSGIISRGGNILQVLNDEYHWGLAAEIDRNAFNWWFKNYQKDWTTDELLQQIEEHLCD